MIDIVYIVHPGDENQELRYSLRSLENLPHGDVWMFGGPAWVKNVRRVDFEDRGKWASLTSAMRIAAERLERFVLFNDDFYVMTPMPEVPVLHTGRLGANMRRHGGSQYMTGRRNAYGFLLAHGVADPLNYEVHAPMTFYGPALDDCFAEMGSFDPQGYVRSVYGNLIGIGGRRCDDFKYGLTPGAPPALPFLSTDATSWRHGYVGDVVRATFRAPSEYE